MERNRRPSAQTVSVLLALAESPASWRYGYDLSQETGLKAGSMYPILMRLADRGMLETSWETDVPAGRPPRHLYRLTGEGRAAAKQIIADQQVAAENHVARSATRALRPRMEGA